MKSMKDVISYAVLISYSGKYSTYICVHLSQLAFRCPRPEHQDGQQNQRETHIITDCSTLLLPWQQPAVDYYMGNRIQ